MTNLEKEKSTLKSDYLFIDDDIRKQRDAKKATMSPFEIRSVGHDYEELYNHLVLEDQCSKLGQVTYENSKELFNLMINEVSVLLTCGA